MFAVKMIALFIVLTVVMTVGSLGLAYWVSHLMDKYDEWRYNRLSR